MENELTLESRFKRIAVLIAEYLPFIDQWDLEVIQGKRFEHPWIDALRKLDKDKLALFDAQREYKILDDPKWIKLVEDIERLSSFDSIELIPNTITPLGNQKKQHELKRLYSFLSNDKEKSAVDFGGGVGNLAYFLEQDLQMDVTVLEKNLELIKTGRAKLKKLGSHVHFQECHICQEEDHPEYNKELAIGLHTCGNFANDMFRTCIHNHTKKIVNFGCCYSKIKNNDYNLSSLSNKKLEFNQRALSSATLGFGPVPLEFYDYRTKIMDYKYTFYHWIYKEHGILEFCAMSNARRSLYKHNFSEFVNINLDKFFKHLPHPQAESINSFHESDENKELNEYLLAYYAISRYIGKLLEVYILCDRALFLKENNYDVRIQEVFDPLISPRNKAIVASLNN